MSLKIPEPPGRSALTAFFLVWVGVLCGQFGWWPAVVAGCAVATVPRRWRDGIGLALGALLAGTLAGFLSIQRDVDVMSTSMPEGSNSALMVASTDAQRSPFGGLWFMARPLALESLGDQAPRTWPEGTWPEGDWPEGDWPEGDWPEGDWPEGHWIEWRGPPLMVNVRPAQAASAVGVQVGHHLLVSGAFRSSPGQAGGITFAGKVAASGVEMVDAGSNPLLQAGNALRNRVLGHLSGRGPSAALVSGFLVGAIDELSSADIDALRLSGISHYVAVSGANVSGFLLLWFILLGPLGVGGRRRGLLGLPAVAVFAVATRWEPSVVRAALMSGLVLAGRSLGIPVDAWMALGWSGALTLLVAPDLAQSLGFQLSVLATAGIMSGGALLPSSLPGWLRGSLGPTLAAQAAVTPLLLGAFGSVPLVSPLSNLIAAPLVSVVTLLGGVGVMTGFEPLISGAVALAGLILDLAHVAAGFPQLGVVGVGLIVAALLIARTNRLRPVVAIAVALFVVSGPLASETVEPPAVVFLDVGQGDASLIFGSAGTTILIDAGPDPPVLAAALRRYGVRSLDLLVISHPHEDHTAGLVGLVDRIPIARVWNGGRGHTGESWELIAAQVATRGVPIETPAVGTVEILGGIRIEVLGPLRRYAGTNDQSVVLMVSAGSTHVLMTGDIEVAAQADLGGIKADILKVPHQGGGTSSLSWLAGVQPQVAVISVGDNNYGHPDPEVIGALSSLGAIVLRTDQVGDVVVPLTGDPLRHLPVAATGPVP